MGPKRELAKLRKELEARYDLKTQVLGPDPEEEKEVKMLNRIIQWTDEGISYEPDPRHGEIMIEQLPVCLNDNFFENEAGFYSNTIRN